MSARLTETRIAAQSVAHPWHIRCHPGVSVVVGVDAMRLMAHACRSLPNNWSSSRAPQTAHPYPAYIPVRMQDLFVGRGQELGLLHDAGTAAAGGRGGLVLLGGEPGIGKSRLADEYATRVASDGALVVWGRCWELGGAPAYWPWTAALRDVIGQRSAAGADELGQLLPELQRPAVESGPGAR